MCLAQLWYNNERGETIGLDTITYSFLVRESGTTRRVATCALLPIRFLVRESGTTCRVVTFALLPIRLWFAGLALLVASRFFQTYPPPAQRIHGRLGPVINAQLSQDRRHVILNRLMTDP